jgi:RNA polymerase sigma-70 factor (ECF subfamily)
MPQATHDETALITALRARDEAAFADLVDLHAPSMLRIARGYVSSTAIAEEVVQETWLALLTGIDSFEGRSSLRTWLSR